MEDEEEDGVWLVCQNGILQKLQAFPTDTDFSLSTSIPPGTATSGNWVRETPPKFQALGSVSEGHEGRFGSYGRNTMWVVSAGRSTGTYKVCPRKGWGFECNPWLCYVVLCCVVLCCVAFDLQLFSCFVENTVVVTVKYLYEWDNLVSEMVASILLWWNVKLGSDSMQTILCIWFVCLRSVSLYNGFHSSLSAIICYFLSTFDISVLLPFIYPILISQKVY